MSFTGFWKNVGLGFAKIGSGSLKAAVWASQHKEVIESVGGTVATMTGHPEVAAVIAALPK